MEINQAILRIKPEIQKKKLAEKRKEQLEAQREKDEEKEWHKQNIRKLRLVKKKWFSKREDIIKDNEFMGGVKFLESEKKHFELVGGQRWLVYFCGDGKFKMQRWGMYMGSDYIRPITLDNIDSIDEKDIDKVAKMYFKKSLKKQILQLGVKK